MKSFLLVVNILALTLPSLVTSQAAEVQNQEQPACCENDERQFSQKKVLYILSHPVPKNYLHNAPNYYPNRAVVPINNPYKCHPYYAQSFVLSPQAQIPQWPFLTNIHQPTVLHHPTKYPSFMVIPSKKSPEKATPPTMGTVAAPEPVPVPAPEPAGNTEEVPEASSEDIPEASSKNVPEASSKDVPEASSKDVPEGSSESVHAPETSTVPLSSPAA